MFGFRLADKWARAIYDLAVEQKLVQAFGPQIGTIIEVFSANPSYVKFFANRNISTTKRKQFFKEAFGAVLNPYLLNACFLIIDRHFASLLVPIMKSVRRQFNLLEKISYGKVYSCVLLSKAQIQRLNQIFSKKLKESIFFKNIIDETLISGLVIKVMHNIIDHSLKNKLTTMKQDLLLSFSKK